MSDETTRRPIHICGPSGTTCIADGVECGSTLPFTRDRGYWNSSRHRCVPDKILRPDGVLVDRIPQSTSAIQHPLPPDRFSRR